MSQPHAGPSPLGALTHSSALAWLLDVRQRLNVSVDLVDHGLTPLLPVSAHRSRAARPSIDLEDQQLHPTILGSMRTLKQEVALVDGVNVVSTPIVGTDGRAAGALLVSDRVSAHGLAQGNQRELARIGAWLAGSIDAQFATALASHAQEFQQLASLHRLLSRVTRSGSEHELVRAFMDAVAVWQDAESWGYVRDLSGRFVRAVSLPGSNDASTPRTISEEGLSSDAVVRLLPEERDALGFRGAGDVLLARVTGRAAAEWLVVVRGALPPQSDARMALYVDVLGRALTAVSGVESSQLTWAILQHLMRSDDGLEEAAARAIEDVSRALRADASFAVHDREGGQVIAVGRSKELLLAPSHDTPGWLSVPVRVPLPFSAAIAIRREDEPLTRADEKLLQSAGLTFAFWLNGVVDRLPGGAERRAARTFEQHLEQHAHDALARREHVSLVVAAIRRHSTPPQVARGWIGRIRASLRPADLAGWLSNGDIAILLPETPEEGAAVVADRIRTALVSESGETAVVSIGIVTRAPGSNGSESLLLDAARRAARNADA